jgi:DNA-binding CsgD family transcriptional regulator/tetratricopeptide (TPR) repeat protein
VLLELGTISHRAGKAFEAVDSFSTAAEIGRELQDAELLARAAIGYEDATWRPGLIRDPIALLEEAVTALGDEPSQLRVGLLSGLARALDMRGQQARAAIIRDNAVALARRLGDRTGLALVLTRAYWARGSTPIEEIQEMLAEARSIGEDLGDTEIQADAISWSVPAFVAVADINSARDKTALLRELAQLTAQPFYLHVAEHYDAAIAIADGRLTAAEELAQRSEEAGRLLTGRDASGTYGIQMFTLRREQGRLAELAPVIRVLTAGERQHGPWRPGLASLLVELDMKAEAKRTLQRIASEGLEPYRESLWLASLTYLTDAAAAVGDEAMAALVYPELAPLSGANVMIGHLVAFYGSADRYLGMLAATLGEWGRAETHFEQALALNRAMGARTWLAHTEYEYARMLTARGRGGSERSALLLGHAADLAHRIGLRTVGAAITAIGATVSSAGFPDELSPREAQILSLVAQGLSNREIGATLLISEHTAANHIRSILRKTGCANRTEAASYAHRHALVDAPARG